MKVIFPILILLLLSVGCKNRSQIKSNLSPKEEIFYSDKQEKMPENIANKIGDWAKVGVKCYGIMLIYNSDKEITNGFTIPCKIVSFHANGIKCKTTEQTFPYEDFGCNKMGVRKGDTWLEKDGDLFQTKEEADNYLASIGAISTFE